MTGPLSVHPSTDMHAYSYASLVAMICRLSGGLTLRIQALSRMGTARLPAVSKTLHNLRHGKATATGAWWDPWLIMAGLAHPRSGSEYIGCDAAYHGSWDGPPAGAMR